MAGPSHLLVGRVGRAVGLRGEVELQVLSDHPGRFSPGSVVWLPDGRPLTVRALRRHRGRTIVAFREVEDRGGAEELRGAELFIPAEQARPLGEREFWDHDLVGCAVVTAGGEVVGAVASVLHLPGQDLLELRDGRLVPLAAPIVVEVDTRGGRITIDPPPGLLDPSEAEEA